MSQIRTVSLYHFIAVPVRIVYQPFSYITQPELLGTDLIADILVRGLRHILKCVDSLWSGTYDRLS